MAVKSTEVKLIAALLESEAEDTGELATRIIAALDEKRAEDDTQWVVVTQWDGVVSMYGPYSTQNKADKALTGLVAPGPGMTAAIRQLRGIE